MEITSIYNNGKPNDVSALGISGLLNWWRMGDNDSGTGTTVTDQAGSNNGTLINAATFVADTPS